MELRTYFWNDRKLNYFHYLSRKWIYNSSLKYQFKYGNAGDIFAVDLLSYEYGLKILNLRNSVNRILCIGSISHLINRNDVLCGIGAKTNQIPFYPNNPPVCWGFRGPITYEIYKKAGYDVSSVKFLADPGLLLKNFFRSDVVQTIPNKIIFIPHYRERHLFNSNLKSYIKFVDIDCAPLAIAKEILSAELVLSSSLHGIIFAHSLGKPCKFILPQTPEPLLKYYDYFESIGIGDPQPLNKIHDFHPLTSIMDIGNIDKLIESIVFPNKEYLISLGIIK